MFSATVAENRNAVVGDEGDLSPQRGDVDRPQVGPVHANLTLGRVVQAREQRHEAGLTGPGRPDQRDRGARVDLELDLAQRGAATVVAQADVVKLDAAGAGAAAAAPPAG